ncbi:hypothetical protein GCM10010123_41130 [Pilimelia anulata]|uniref:Uncharacterized protein n=1 Tax=Pilimelia anulata TaxID=53371 RepID=A0A8J3FC18_9ACTN|nr:hypothetical protein [Pilimelia anulata]GGK07098.1 hypothetical protein GCM10010123_41130 [Pilimelia anulata]
METPTACLKVTNAAEVALYERMFANLQAAAVHGRGARRLIAAAMDEVYDGDPL